MKKTKTIEEYYCDFCGHECTDEHYDVALPNSSATTFTATRMGQEVIKSEIWRTGIVHLNLCEKCAKKNRSFI